MVFLQAWTAKLKSAVFHNLFVCNSCNEKLTVYEFSTIKGNPTNYRSGKIYEARKIKCEKPLINNQTKDFGVIFKLFDSIIVFIYNLYFLLSCHFFLYCPFFKKFFSILSILFIYTLFFCFK